MFIFQINKTIDNNQRVLDVLDNNHRILDAIDNFCEAVLGKGYDKLQQWRKGEIDRINYDEVSQLNWEIYLREEAEKTYNNWLKENPTYFEDKNNNGSSCSLISMLGTLENENKGESNMNNKENLKEYIEELRDEMNYWGVSSEAHDAIEHILRKMEKLTEK